MSFKRSRGSGTEKSLSLEEQQSKIDEVKKIIGPIADKLPSLCSDASLSRYLRARSWNSKRAAKMLKETLKWRLEYKPENIRWDDIAEEAKTGKVYRSNYLDKFGRTVLVMRPGCPEWNMSSVSVKVTRETANILQNRYPERLGLAILYNPPKIFESFWTMVKPFLEHKTSKKVRFVYSDDPETQRIMESVFDMDKLESVFGGRNSMGFDFKEYGERMKEDDKKMCDFISSGCSSFSHQSSVVSFLQTESVCSDQNSEVSDAISSSSEEGCSLNLEGNNESVDENNKDQLDSKAVTDVEEEAIKVIETV